MDFVLYGLVGATLALVLLQFLFLRFGLPRLLAGLASNFAGALRPIIMGWAFDESEEVLKDGSRRKVLKPSASFLGLVDALAPVLISNGLEWVKRNVKVGSVTGGEGGGVAGVVGPELIKKLPKEWRGIAEIALPFLPQILKALGMGAPGAPGAAPGAAPTTGNPFAGELNP